MLKFVLPFFFNFMFLNISEHMFKNFVEKAMPIYTNYLRDRGLFRFYTSNLPAFINASWCTIYGVYGFIFKTWDLPTLAVAYFVYDLIRGCRKQMVLHHIAGIVLLLISKAEHYKVAPVILMSEVSTIFLCLSSVLSGPVECRRTLLQEEKVKLRNFKIAFITTFFIFRIILAPIVHFKHCSELKMVENIVLLYLTIQNMVWFLKIIIKHK
jgi:hypothetical protein